MLVCENVGIEGKMQDRTTICASGTKWVEQPDAEFMVQISPQGIVQVQRGGGRKACTTEDREIAHRGSAS